MAVEEEGLRVFQSVKIKIGKKKSLPPSLSASADGPTFTGSARGQDGPRVRAALRVIVIPTTRFPLRATIGTTNDKSGKKCVEKKKGGGGEKKNIEGLKTVWDIVGI